MPDWDPMAGVSQSINGFFEARQMVPCIAVVSGVFDVREVTGRPFEF